MPLAVAKSTVTVFVLTNGMLTVKTKLVVPLSPSARLTSSIDSEASSLRIVPWPWPSGLVALLGLVRLTTNVSWASGVVSPLTWTVMVLDVSPGANVRVPEVDR